jgi:hypothetical protein
MGAMAGSTGAERVPDRYRCGLAAGASLGESERKIKIGGTETK